MNRHTVPARLPWRWFGCIALLAAVSTASGQSYTFISLGSLGGTSAANGINDLGQIVGYATLSTAAGSRQYAVIWNNTSPMTLADVGSYSSANGINNAGQIVGASNQNGDAVTWNSAASAAQVLSSNYSTAFAINTAGQIVGFANGPLPTLWSGSTTTALDLAGVGASTGTAYAINNAGQAVGVSVGPAGSVATLWNGTASSLLPPANPQYPGNESYAYAVNDLGQAVGFTYASYQGTQCVYTNLVATVWSSGLIPWPNNQPISSNSCANVGLQLDPNAVLLFALGEQDLPTRALAINNAGQVVGWSCTTCYEDNLQHAVLWNNSVYPIDLDDFLSAEMLAAGWILWSANGINNNGVIVGQDYNTVTGEYGAFELVPVPNTTVSVSEISIGQSATLSVNPSGIGPFTYQWFQGSSGDTSMPIAGATESSYTTPALAASANYWVQVTAGSVSETSATITVTVAPGEATAGTDAPLPAWASGVLALLLLGCGSQRIGALSVRVRKSTEPAGVTRRARAALSSRYDRPRC
jgi:probable HAF family extracellular repeat protein